MIGSPSFFTTRGPFSDIVLKCENGNLFAAKAILGLWSPVLRDLIMNVENVTEIPLPNKSVEEVLILLQHVYPHFTEEVKEAGEAEVLLSLAHEYDIAAAKSAAEAFLCDHIVSACEDWDGQFGHNISAMDALEQSLQLSTRYEAPRLKAACEEIIVGRPSSSLAMLAEKFELRRALESCVRFVAENFGAICADTDEQDALSQLSANTLIRIGAGAHARAMGEIFDAKEELNNERKRLSSLRMRLVRLAFSTEHRDAMMCGSDWSDLTETFGPSFINLTGDVHVSRTLRWKIDDAFKKEGIEQPGTPVQKFPRVEWPYLE